MANRNEPVAGRRAVAPVRHPGGFEPEPCLGVLSIEPAWQTGRMRAHIGDALVVRRAARAGDAAARAPEIPGDDGKIDAGRRDLGRIAVVVVTGSRQLFVGDGLVDQRRRVLGIGQRARAAGRVENRGLRESDQRRRR